MALSELEASGAAWFAEETCAAGGATDAGLKLRGSEAFAPPLPLLGPLGRRCLGLDPDCVCAAGCADASACMVAVFEVVKLSSVSRIVVLASLVVRRRYAVEEQIKE